MKIRHPNRIRSKKSTSIHTNKKPWQGKNEINVNFRLAREAALYFNNIFPNEIYKTH